METFKRNRFKFLQGKLLLPRTFQAVKTWKTQRLTKELWEPWVVRLSEDYKITIDKQCKRLTTRNALCGTWYLPHSHVNNERTVPVIMAGCIAHA